LRYVVVQFTFLIPLSRLCMWRSSFLLLLLILHFIF
jgi:hypothetical protein